MYVHTILIFKPYFTRQSFLEHVVGQFGGSWDLGDLCFVRGRVFFGRIETALVGYPNCGFDKLCNCLSHV